MEEPSLKDEITLCVYGLGKTGISVVNYLNRKGFTGFYVWDDYKVSRSYLKINSSRKEQEKIFSHQLDVSDYIILSPGININNAHLKKKLVENKQKIITDLDLLYLFNPEIKTIIITPVFRII